MRKSYLVLLITLAAVPAIVLACGGAAETEETDGGSGSATPEELCTQACRDYSDCLEGGFGGGSGESYYSSCRNSCFDAVDTARERECGPELKDLLECNVEEFSCAAALGSGDLTCDRQTARFYDCMSQGSGSGS